jgi:hypothetical protein
MRGAGPVALPPGPVRMWSKGRLLEAAGLRDVPEHAALVLSGATDPGRPRRELDQAIQRPSPGGRWAASVPPCPEGRESLMVSEHIVRYGFASLSEDFRERR